MILWLASYPKSGNTWLRSIISSYYYSKNGEFNFDLLRYVTQFPQSKFFSKKYNKPGESSVDWINAQKNINKNNRINIFKTHNALLSLNGNNFTNKINTLGGIYIIRDPRNVVTSLKNHFDITYDEAFDFMLNKKKYIYDINEPDNFADFHFLSSWSVNYQSWINNKIFKIKLIKYEDLEKNTYAIMKEIIFFINKIINSKTKFNPEKLKNSINNTTFEKLKSKEKNEGFSESIISPNNKKIDFFHLGPKNKWENLINEDLKLKMNKIFYNDLKFLGYKT